MKRLLFLLFATFVFISAIHAQAPQGINYQAVARNVDTSPIANTTLNVGIKIKDGFNNTLYSEQHNPSTGPIGLFNIVIGQGNLPSGNFSAIDWASGQKYLEVTINGVSGPLQPLQSVPYALYAGKTNLQAGNGISVNGNVISNTGDLSNTNEIQTLTLNGNQLSLSNGGGTVNLPAPPTYVPDIAIFEERTNNGTDPLPPSGDHSWSKRQLSYVVKPSASVHLDGANIKFDATGTYLITASAPAYQTIRHRLCLKENGDVIKIAGSSEYTADTAPNSGSVTRSFLTGILVVNNTNTFYYLDHYIQNNAGGNVALGVESSSLNNTVEKETYAQIMIQKIQ